MPRRRASEDEWEDERMIGGQQRNAANARERARMRVLSRAFCRLKTTLPWVPADTKLSKLDTLRLATSYIAHLRALLCLDRDDDSDSAGTNVHPLNLTWPFSFQPSPIADGGVSCQNEVTSTWNDGRNDGSSSSSPCSGGRSEECMSMMRDCSGRLTEHERTQIDYSDKNASRHHEVRGVSRSQFLEHDLPGRLHSYYNGDRPSSYSDSLLQI